MSVEKRSHLFMLVPLGRSLARTEEPTRESKNQALEFMLKKRQPVLGPRKRSAKWDQQRVGVGFSTDISSLPGRASEESSPKQQAGR
jgi:hypothetical protein